VSRSEIPQTSPLASYLAHKADIDKALAAVLESGQYVLGHTVARFEREFAAYVGADHAAGVASGTDALHLGLRALGVGEGDLVVTVANTAVATASAIRQTGAGVVFADVDEATLLLDPRSLDRLLARDTERRIRAIVPVHLYGRCAPMEEIMDLARRYDLVVIEDCAQAHGARRNGRMAGTWGDAAAFSFYPTKNLGALGDGGALTTNSESLATTVRRLRQYGWDADHISLDAAFNSRLDALQAAILSAKLPFLENENDRRRKIAAHYDERLAAVSPRLRLLPFDSGHVYHQYVVRTSHRDSLQAAMSAAGIHTIVHYPVPIHLQPGFARGVVLPADGVPVTEKAASEVLSLPMYPQLEDQQFERVCQAVAAWADGTLDD
jgi:dTDP-4-amino-4,6-dideoxygalactose transaminase